MTPSRTRRADLEACLHASLRAVAAGPAVARALGVQRGRVEIFGRPLAPGAGLVVLAVGKAAASMARAVEEAALEHIRDGLVVTPAGHARPLERLPLIESAHPLPDERSARAADAVLALLRRAAPQDLLLVLLSGGTSALLSLPLPGLSLAELGATTDVLLRSGAGIDELNTVRKHTCALTGGRLARAAAARRIAVLAVSDVPGDRLELIGSGPFAPDSSCFADARAVLERRDPEGSAPEAVRALLERGARGEVQESLRPGAPELARVTHHIIARNADARRAAVQEAVRRGFCGIDLGEVLRGEARVAGRRLAALGQSLAAPRGVVLVAGGETAVTVRGAGRGGRSQELALAAAQRLQGTAELALLASGTDGSDGPTDAAGAYADGGTLDRASARGQDARMALAANDAYGFFRAEGGLFRTGPTGTNVMDLVLLSARNESGA